MTSFTEAIVLAGGLGTRLRSAVPDKPKALAPVAGRPFLTHQLCALRRQGIERVVLALGHRAEMIREVMGHTACGLELCYSLEDTPLGTGGAMRQASALCREERVLALNGDTFLEFDAPSLWQALRQREAAAMVLVHVDDISRYGAVEMAAGRVRRFREKGAGGPGLINGGVYALNRSWMDGIWPRQVSFSFERDVLPILAETDRLAGVVTSGRFLDIGTPEDYARAEAFLGQDPASDR